MQANLHLCSRGSKHFLPKTDTAKISLRLGRRNPRPFPPTKHLATPPSLAPAHHNRVRSPGSYTWPRPLPPLHSRLRTTILYDLRGAITWPRPLQSRLRSARPARSPGSYGNAHLESESHSLKWWRKAEINVVLLLFFIYLKIYFPGF